METMENQNVNLLKTRRMMLEFRYLDMEHDEVSLLSEQYVEQFLNDLRGIIGGILAWIPMSSMPKLKYTSNRP